MRGSTQPVFVPLGGNLDTGIDDKLLPVGKVPQLSNCFVDRTGEVVKRGGTTALSTGATPGSSVLAKTWQLSVYKNALVSLQLTSSTSPMYLYSAVTGQWSRVADPGVASDASIKSGIRARVSHSLIPVVSEIGLTATPDVAYSGGYYFTCFSNAVGNGVLRAIDATTNQTVYTWTTTLRGLGTRVIVTNGYLVLLYIDDAAHNLKADVWLISTGFDATVGAPTTYTVATGLDAASAPYVFFDVINAPGVTTACAVAYRTNANTLFRVDFTPSTGGTVANEIKTAGAVSINATQAFNWMRDLGVSNRLAMITCTAISLQVQWDMTAGTPANTYTLNAAPGTDVRSVVGHTNAATAGGEFTVIYDVYNNATPQSNRRIRMSQCNSVGTVTDGEWVRSVGITSKTFLYGSSFWVVANYESPAALQSSFFLLRVPTDALSNPQQTAPQARIALWNSAGNATSTVRSHPSAVATISSTQFSVAISTAVGGLNFTAGTGAGVKIAALTFDSAAVGPAREAADNLYVPGSMLGVFSGRNFEEDGFSIYPEQPASSIAALGSLTENGTYVYQIVYAVSDENGRAVRSVPSVPITVSLNVAFRLDVDLATRSALPACTAVGTGIGKYLIETAASGVGVAVDGVKVKEGAIVLVQNQAATVDNGAYICTNAGLPPSAWQLTRSPLYDGSASHVPLAGDIISVRNVSAATNGATNRGKQFALQGAGPFTVDVSNLVFAASALSRTINLTIPTLRLTDKAVTIEVYRTQANQQTGTLTLVGTVANTTTADTVAFADTFSDASIAAGLPLYTTGGVHENDPAPGLSGIFVAKDRVFGVSMDDPTELWFTDPIVPGQAPNWNENNIISLADEHGPAYAGGPIDDKVVLFKQDTTYAFNGDGPDNAGHGAFPQPQLVATGIGCSNPQAVAASRDGVFFRSTSSNVGLKLIDRSLTVVDVGTPVRANDALTCVAAFAVPSQDQVRFVMSSKTVNVYDIVAKQWSTYAYQDASAAFVHAVAWNGTVAMATDTPSVLVEDQSRTIWTDAGVSFAMTIASPWVQLAGIKGFNRLHKVQGVGVSVASVPLTVTIFVNFATAVTSTYVGTPGATWNWEMIPRVQRGSSFKVVTSETSATAGHKVSGVTMQIGIKTGVGRQAASTRLVGQ